MDRKGPLGGKENLEADFSSVSDRTAIALSRVCPAVLSAGVWDVGITGDQGITLYDTPADKFLFLDKIILYAGYNDGGANYLEESFNIMSGAVDILDKVFASSPLSFSKWTNGEGPNDLNTCFILPSVDLSAPFPVCWPILTDPLTISISNLVAFGFVRYLVFGTLIDPNQ